MRVHYLQHVSFEGLGSIEPWLLNHGYHISSTRLYADEELPEPDTLDFLIIMGGPMSVNDETVYPWLAKEKNFVRKVMESGTPVLGICLGAQLIASSLGGSVFPGEHKEIGWFPVGRAENAKDGVFLFPRQLDVFHWHGETFTLPDGAVLLARSEGCLHQAFQLGRTVIGLQFHLETTPQTAETMVENCRNELVSGPYIQNEAAILTASSENYAVINRVMEKILSYLTDTFVQLAE